ncbi:MAG: DUF86 domain-containing protein [Anaerolineaceae bacterium]
MSPRYWRERINDIIAAIDDIHFFIGEMKFVDFMGDNKTISAVELKFIIIGEAASAIPEDIQEKFPHIEWHLMKAIRNRLVHMYFSITPEILWNTINQEPSARSRIIEDGNRTK